MTGSVKAVICLLAALAVAGCTSVSRGIGAMTANKYAKPRSGIQWVVAPPQLEPPALKDKTVYISFRDIAGADIDLLPVLERAARDEGWTLVRDPQKAMFRLRATVRFFGEVAPDSGGMAVASGLGWIGGAAVGAGTGLAVSGFTGGRSAGTAVGVGVGLAAGGLMQVGMSNASTPREWAMIVDFVLEEHMDEPVEFELAADSDAVLDGRADTGNRRLTSGGGDEGGNTSYVAATRRSNYYPHGLRLSVWANQMNMAREEARPLIIGQAEKVIGEVLPK